MFLEKKKKLSRNYPRWRYRHEKPACRFLKTSQESREWLIFSTQCYRVLISSPLSPSQKECETNPSREQKNAAVFANWIRWRKIAITSLTEVTAVSRTNVRHKRKTCPLSTLVEKLCVQARNILTNLSPSLARSENPGLICNSTPCQKFDSKSSACTRTRKCIWD